MNRARGSSGAGLIEALVATAVVVTAASTLAGLTSLALRTILAGRDRTVATILAQSRLEVLRSSRLSLPTSPPDALDTDIDGYHEQIDADGRAARRDPAHAGAVYVCRWRVAPYPGRVGLTVITVLASRCVSAAQRPRGCAARADAVRVAGVRSEAAW